MCEDGALTITRHIFWVIADDISMLLGPKPLTSYSLLTVMQSWKHGLLEAAYMYYYVTDDAFAFQDNAESLCGSDCLI